MNRGKSIFIAIARSVDHFFSRTQTQLEFELFGIRNAKKKNFKKLLLTIKNGDKKELLKTKFLR